MTSPRRRDRPRPVFGPNEGVRVPLGLLARPWLAGLLIAGAGIVVYSNSFAAPMVFDGVDHVRNNPALRQLWPPWGWLAFSTRPVAFGSFALNYALGGNNVWGYHCCVSK